MANEDQHGFWWTLAVGVLSSSIVAYVVSRHVFSQQRQPDARQPRLVTRRKRRR